MSRDVDDSHKEQESKINNSVKQEDSESKRNQQEPLISGPNDRDRLLEQYIHFSESAIATSNRRVTTNRFFGTLLTGVLALLTIFSPSANSSLQFLAICIVGIGGSVLCIFWRQTIKSYQELNSAKYKIINSIEEELPVSPYRDEWRYLEHREEDPELITSSDKELDHPSQTTVETKLVWALGIGYWIITFFGIIGFIFTLTGILL